MIITRIPVSEFKAKLTRILREFTETNQIIEVTNHGKVVAVVSPPDTPSKPDPTHFWGSMAGKGRERGDIIGPTRS